MVEDALVGGLEELAALAGAAITADARPMGLLPTLIIGVIHHTGWRHHSRLRRHRHPAHAFAGDLRASLRFSALLCSSIAASTDLQPAAGQMPASVATRPCVAARSTPLNINPGADSRAPAQATEVQLLWRSPAARLWASARDATSSINQRSTNRAPATVVPASLLAQTSLQPLMPWPPERAATCGTQLRLIIPPGFQPLAAKPRSAAASESRAASRSP